MELERGAKRGKHAQACSWKKGHRHGAQAHREACAGMRIKEIAQALGTGSLSESMQNHGLKECAGAECRLIEKGVLRANANSE